MLARFKMKLYIKYASTVFNEHICTLQSIIFSIDFFKVPSTFVFTEVHSSSSHDVLLDFIFFSEIVDVILILNN
jgi:hypothetical protein